MGLFNKSNTAQPEGGGIINKIASNFQANIIKWEPEEEDGTIVHKFEAEDFPNGSQLIIAPSMMAVFINYVSSGDSLEGNGQGKAQVSVFNGAEKITLNTGDSRFAPFKKMATAFTGGETAFHSKVYFVKTNSFTNLDWGVGLSSIYDHEYNMTVNAGAEGRYGIHIEHMDRALAAIQVRKFIEKVVGTRSDFTLDDLQDFLAGKINELVPPLITNTLAEKQLGVNKIQSFIPEFSKSIKEQLAPYCDDFGITLENFSFSRISINEEDFKKIKEGEAAKRAASLQIDTEEERMRRLDIARQEAEMRLRLQEEQAHLGIAAANADIYRFERQADVMAAAAANEGGQSQFMNMGMGLGMGAAMGGAFGQGIGNMMQGAMAPEAPAPATAPEAPKATCPQCGATVEPNSKFCMSCGKKLIEEILCPGCGKPVAKDAKFCGECGYKLIKSCPNCGKEVGSGKFCPDCGTAL